MLIWVHTINRFADRPAKNLATGAQILANHESRQHILRFHASCFGQTPDPENTLLDPEALTIHSRSSRSSMILLSQFLT